MAVFSVRPAELTIAYEELEDSPQEHWGRGGAFEATRLLKCVWDDRVTLAAELRGQRFAEGAIRIRTLPHEYPQNTTVRAFVVDVTCRGMGGIRAAPADDQVQEYEHALLTVKYAVPDYDLGAPSDPEETFFEESIEPVVEFITLSSRNLFWDQAQTVKVGEGERPGRLRLLVNWIFTDEFVGTIPSTVLSLLGKVNDAQLIAPRFGLTFGPETLLYNPPRLSRQFNDEGERAWQIRYSFTYNPDGWNTFYKDGTNQAQPIYDENGQQVKPYTPESFTGVVPQ